MSAEHEKLKTIGACLKGADDRGPNPDRVKHPDIGDLVVELDTASAGEDRAAPSLSRVRPPASRGHRAVDPSRRWPLATSHRRACVPCGPILALAAEGSRQARMCGGGPIVRESPWRSLSADWPEGTLARALSTRGSSPAEHRFCVEAEGAVSAPTNPGSETSPSGQPGSRRWLAPA
jgi:hypothetical protein